MQLTNKNNEFFEVKLLVFQNNKPWKTSSDTRTKGIGNAMRDNVDFKADWKTLKTILISNHGEISNSQL